MKMETALVAFLVFIAGSMASSFAQQPQSAPQQGTPQDEVQIESKALIGSAVSAHDGKNLGKVANLMIDPREGRIKTLVISMGSRFGSGKEVSVPWSDVQVGRDQNNNLVVSLQRDMLPPARSKDEGNRPPSQK